MQSTSISLLSSELLLEIFSYLDPESLLQIAKVCKTFNLLSEDPLFWNRQLQLMRHTCSSFCSCHTSHLLGRPESSSKKAFYCKIRREQGTCQSHNLPFGYFQRASPLSLSFPSPSLPFSLSLSPPICKIILFGPGLDNDGANLVHDIMWGANSPFKTLGMFPSAHNGIGGGVRLAYKAHELNLITLYRATKKEREAMALALGPRINKVIDNQFMLQQSIGVVRAADCLIYVCDRKIPLGDEIRQEFQILVAAAPPTAPLLLLMPFSEEGDVTAADYVDFLGLASLSRRWYLYTVDVEGEINRLDEGLDWLLRSPLPPSSSSSSSSPLNLPDPQGLVNSIANALPRLANFSFPSIF